MQTIQDFFVKYFNPEFATFLISILPIFELKGAIPFGMSSIFWGSEALPLGTAFIISFLGSSLMIPILYFLYKPLLRWLKKIKVFKNISLKIEERIEQKSKVFQNKNTKYKQMLGIICFVAIPLPLTGVYMGCAISAFLGFSFWDTLVSVITGNLCAGIIIAVLSSLSENAANIVFLVFIVIVVIILIIYLFKKIIQKIRKTKKKASKL